MLGLYRQIQLPGGVTINITDLTRIYFGDFYLVKLEIHCEIPAGEPAITGGLATTSAGKSHKNPTYVRYLTRMGVPSADVEAVKLALVTDFETNALPYIISSVFPAKLLASRERMVLKPVKTYMEKNL